MRRQGTEVRGQTKTRGQNMLVCCLLASLTKHACVIARARKAAAITQSYLNKMHMAMQTLAETNCAFIILFLFMAQCNWQYFVLQLPVSSLLHSVNLILFTVLLVHLILRISPHHSHHPRCHHLSLPLPFTPDLKLISFTNPFLHSHLLLPD